MKVTAFIRCKDAAKNNTSDMVHVYFRVRDGKTDIKAASELAINPNHWSPEAQGYKSRVSLVSETKRVAFNKSVHELTALISEQYYRGADGDWLKSIIENYHHPNLNKLGGSGDKNNSFVARIREYIDTHPMTDGGKQHHIQNAKKLERFEHFMRDVKKRRGFYLNIDTMTASDMRLFQDFLLHEHEYYTLYPKIYEGIQQQYAPRQLALNTLNTIFRRLRTVMNWCLKNNYTSNDAFSSFETPKDLYGPPFYLTLEERDIIYNADFSDCCRSMQVYADIFVFQCLIGCRVGDLQRLTKDNIIDGVVEYVAEKTKGHNPRTIRVPLNEKAKALLAKFSGVPGNKLLPKINETYYNDSIRKILKKLGINRMVPVLNLYTRETEMRPLCDVATSHTARKTFIGNLYKKVKDPALVASLSGHTDGSRAFARYREIDNDMKRELVGLID